jgi:hypothetical protein
MNIKLLHDESIESINELNDKQKDFCREYSISWNGTMAYQKVYGVGEDVARSSAARLLANVNIQKFLNYCRSHSEETVGLTRNMVLNEYKKLALSNIKTLRNSWLTLREFDELTEDQMACIQGIEHETRTEMKAGQPVQIDKVKIKLHNKQAALDSICRMQGYNSAEVFDINVARNDQIEQMSTPELLERIKAIKQFNKENE